MPDLDEQLYDEESQRQAEIELEAQRRQKLQAQQEQQQAQQAGAAGLAAQAVEQGKEMVKQQVKRKIIQQILIWLGTLLLNPYTWIAIGLLGAALLLAWCSEEKAQCATALTQVFYDTVIKPIFGE